MRPSGTQACLSTLSSYLTVCHCEPMKPDAIIADSRNFVFVAQSRQLCIHLNLNLSDRHSVFMCVCGRPTRLSDDVFCTGYGFACLLLLPSACNQVKVPRMIISCSSLSDGKFDQGKQIPLSCMSLMSPSVFCFSLPTSFLPLSLILQDKRD